MKYIVKFNFDCVNKHGLISAKSGESEITADASPNDIKKSQVVMGLIAADMERLKNYKG